jgi:hypothetical protein
MFTKSVVLAAVAATLLAGTALADGTLPGRPASNVVFEDGVGTSFLIPVAGSVEGANGTYFRSEVTLVNFKNGLQEVLVEFMPQGSSTPIVHRLDLEPRKFKFWHDFVGTELGYPGVLGALRFRAVIAGTTNIDTTALLNGFSRIWTQIPGSAGTSSMSLPAIVDADLAGLEAAYVIGLRQDAQYRTNTGIVNLEGFDRTFLVEPLTSAQPAASFTVTVPARSMRQVPIPPGDFGGVVLRITPTSEGSWSAYGASVDNVSGDGWVSKAQYSTPQQ